MHYTKINLTIPQLKRLFEHFVEEGYLSPDTREQDFIYYFSGVGTQPQTKLHWLSTKTLLSIYIKELTGNEGRPEWKYTDGVFDNATAASLRDTHSRPFSKDTSRSFDTFFEYQRQIRDYLMALTNMQ